MANRDYGNINNGEPKVFYKGKTYSNVDDILTSQINANANTNANQRRSYPQNSGRKNFNQFHNRQPDFNNGIQLGGSLRSLPRWKQNQIMNVIKNIKGNPGRGNGPYQQQNGFMNSNDNFNQNNIPERLKGRLNFNNRQNQNGNQNYENQNNYSNCNKNPQFVNDGIEIINDSENEESDENLQLLDEPKNADSENNIPGYNMNNFQQQENEIEGNNFSFNVHSDNPKYEQEMEFQKYPQKPVLTEKAKNYLQKNEIKFEKSTSSVNPKHNQPEVRQNFKDFSKQTSNQIYQENMEPQIQFEPINHGQEMIQTSENLKDKYMIFILKESQFKAHFENFDDKMLSKEIFKNVYMAIDSISKDSQTSDKKLVEDKIMNFSNNEIKTFRNFNNIENREPEMELDPTEATRLFFPNLSSIYTFLDFKLQKNEIKLLNTNNKMDTLFDQNFRIWFLKRRKSPSDFREEKRKRTNSSINPPQTNSIIIPKIENKNNIYPKADLSSLKTLLNKPEEKKLPNFNIFDSKYNLKKSFPNTLNNKSELENLLNKKSEEDRLSSEKNNNKSNIDSKEFTKTVLDLTNANEEELKNLQAVEIFNKNRKDKGKLSGVMNSQWKVFLYRTLGVPLKRV